MVKVTDSQFARPNDYPINFHGTHLKVVDQPAPNQIVVGFIHD